MVLLYTLIASAATIWVVHKTRFWSPASFGCFYATAQMWFYYIVGQNYHEAIYLGVKFAHRYDAGLASQTAAIYCLIVVLTAAACIGLPDKNALITDPKVKRRVQLIQDLMSPRNVTFLALSMIPLSVAYYILMQNLDAGSTLFRMLEKVSLGGALCLVALMVYCAQEKIYLPMLVLAACSFYFYTYVLDSYSRGAALIWAIAGALIIARLIYDKKPVICVSVVICFFFAAWFYVYATQFRYYRHQNLGLGVELQQMMSIHLINPDGSVYTDYFGGATENVMIGPFVLDGALRMGHCVNTQKYMMLSFSPLPSMIDKYDNIVTEGYRLNSFTPFSAIAEDWNFGETNWIFWVLGVLYLVIPVRILTATYLKLGPAWGYFFTLPSVVGFVVMHAYSVRITQHFFVYPAAICWLLMLWLDKKMAKELMVNRALAWRTNLANLRYLRTGNVTVPQLTATD